MADSKKFVVERYEPSGWVDEKTFATRQEAKTWKKQQGVRGTRYRIVEVCEDSTEY